HRGGRHRIRRRDRSRDPDGRCGGDRAPARAPARAARVDHAARGRARGRAGVRRGRRVMAGTVRLGVDIGGTFTDIVLLAPDGRVVTKKVSSSTDDYARAIVEGLQQVFAEGDLTSADIAEVLHGTTV